MAKEVGEDIIPDVVEAMMKLASHTSGSVITLILANLPLAASRLGDVEVMRGFLKLLHQMTGKAPTENSKGLRLGSFDQIRAIIDEELEAVWAGSKDAQAALDDAVNRGNELLRRFERSAQ